MTLRLSILLLAVLTTTDCHRHADPQVARSALMQADIDFEKATASRGIDGWVSFFAPDGSQFPNNRPVVTGLDSIRALMTPQFADTTVRLTWQPDQAEVARSGELGYTLGRWKLLKRGLPVADAELAVGKYVTIWRKQADGSWKVAVDIGNSSAPPPAAPKP